MRASSIHEESDHEEVSPLDDVIYGREGNNVNSGDICRQPPETNKDTIYTTPDVFKDQDNQAIEVFVEHLFHIIILYIIIINLHKVLLL